MGNWLAGLPTAALWAIVVLPATAVSLGVLSVVRRRFPPESAKPYNDVVGFAHGIVGVVYAVLLGFTIIVSWEQFEAADRNVSDEASVIADLYNDNKLLVATFRDEHGTSANDLAPSGRALNAMQWALQNYVNAVVYTEWEAIAAGREDETGRKAYEFIWAAYNKYSETTTLTPLQAAFFAEVLRKLNELGAHRRARLADARKSMPMRFWTLLIGGGFLMIGFAFLYGIPNGAIHGVIVTTLTVLIGVCLAMMVSLEHPFRGGISNQPFVTLQSTDPWSAR